MDIFKSLFLANTVSERSTISLFFYINDLEGSNHLFWHLQVGRRGEEGVHGRFIAHSLASFFSFRFLSLLRVSVNDSPLSAYKSEATMLGLTEIQARFFVCFLRDISQNSFTFPLTFQITLLDSLLLKLLC